MQFAGISLHNISIIIHRSHCHYFAKIHIPRHNWSKTRLLNSFSWFSLISIILLAPLAFGWLNVCATEILWRKYLHTCIFALLGFYIYIYIKKEKHPFILTLGLGLQKYFKKKEKNSDQFYITFLFVSTYANSGTSIFGKGNSVFEVLIDIRVRTIWIKL